MTRAEFVISVGVGAAAGAVAWLLDCYHMPAWAHPWAGVIAVLFLAREWGRLA